MFRGAKLGLVDYISRHPFQQAKKVSNYDEEFIVAKLKLISASFNLLHLNITHPATHIHQLLKTHDPVSQTTPKLEADIMAINLISTHAARVHKNDYYNSPAPRKLASNITCNLNNLKYVDPTSQIPLNTSLAQHNTKNYNQLV